MLEIPNMIIYRLDRPIKKGGGVCIYVSVKWAKYIKIVEPLSYINKDVKVITISLTKPAFRKLQISSLYRPPCGSTDICHDNLKKIICQGLELNYELWISGDFNIDYLSRDRLDVKKYTATLK